MLVVDATQAWRHRHAPTSTSLLTTTRDMSRSSTNRYQVPTWVVVKVEEKVSGCGLLKALPNNAKTGDGVTWWCSKPLWSAYPPGNPNAAQGTHFKPWYDSYRASWCGPHHGRDAPQRRQDRAVRHEEPVIRLGVFIKPESRDMDQLSAGEVGFLCGSCHQGTGRRKVGVPLRWRNAPAPGRCPAEEDEGGGLLRRYRPIRRLQAAQVRAGKLPAQRRGLLIEPETSQASASLPTAAPLNLLHIGIIQERLEREFRVDLITATTPSVIYQVVETTGQQVHGNRQPSNSPITPITNLYEPTSASTSHVPSDYVSAT